MTPNDQHIVNLISGAVKAKDPLADIILYGSHARGTAHKESDWDVLVLLNRAKVSLETEKEFRYLLTDIEIDTGEPISALILSKQEWESKYSITPFYNNVIREGLHI